MPTECSPTELRFGSVEGRAIVAGFDGGTISSDAGALLLGATDRAIGLVDRFARCFIDGRNPALIEHQVRTIVGQRILGLALGYEDIVDHDLLRHDPILQAVIGKMTATDPKCAPLAGKSTLNRLEHSPEEGEVDAPGRYHKIEHDSAAIESLFVDLFLEAHPTPKQTIILDIDATDIPLHGRQEGRFFHGFYDAYCYLPLYVFCDRHLLAARLRRADTDAAAGVVEEIARIVARIRARWPDVLVIVRGDSGFCREPLMRWCEDNGVHYLLGLAKNDRLVAAIAPELAEVEARAKASKRAERSFKDLMYATRGSWSRERRVVAKAEWTEGEANPRFVVTSLDAEVAGATWIYEQLYCKRGDMENRIKETKLDLFGDRTSASTMRSNQLRLWLSGMAYVLMCALRRLGLAGTDLERATCQTLRVRLLKIGALVTVSVRRVKIAMATSCPSGSMFERAHARLEAHAAGRPPTALAA